MNRAIRSTLILLCAGVVPALAGPIEVGVKGGVPLTDFLTTARNQNFAYISQTKRYVVGPSLQLNLPAGFAVEFDALYRRMSYEALTASPSPVTAGAWEFPLLLKYRLVKGPVRPFVDAGMAWDKLSGLKQSVVELRNSTVAGFVLGGGIELHTPLVKITPELRYTQWGSQHFRDAVSGLLHSNESQAEFLLGISF